MRLCFASSTTFTASPSKTRSKSCVATVNTHRGSRARFFAGAGPCVEVEGVIHPQHAQRHGGWPAVREHRCQPARVPVQSARFWKLRDSCFKPLTNLAPGIVRRAIAAEVLLRRRIGSLIIVFCHTRFSSYSLTMDGALTCSI